MLSRAEAEGLNFLERAGVTNFAGVSSDSMDADVQALVSRLLGYDARSTKTFT